MNKLETSFVGGMPIVLDDIRWEQDAVRDVLYGLVSSFGIDPVDSFKLSGAVVTVAGTTYTATNGYICLNGEICKVVAHSLTVTSGHSARWVIEETYDAAGSKTYEDASSHDTYSVRQAVLEDYTISVPTVDMAYNAPYLIDIIQSKLNALGDTSWHVIGATGEPSYAGAWTQCADSDVAIVAYRKDAWGRVFLKGTAEHSSGSTGIVFQLPTGYRPSENLNYIARGALTDPVKMQISTDGYVFLSTTGVTKVAFDNISFFL